MNFVFYEKRVFGKNGMFITSSSVYTISKQNVLKWMQAIALVLMRKSYSLDSSKEYFVQLFDVQIIGKTTFSTFVNNNLIK